MGSGSRRLLRGFLIRVGKSNTMFLRPVDEPHTLLTVADECVAVLQHDHLSELQVLLPGQGVGDVHGEVRGRGASVTDLPEQDEGGR
jgi:hypothetical protein